MGDAQLGGQGDVIPEDPLGTDPRQVHHVKQRPTAARPVFEIVFYFVGSIIKL
jgi:hypothetical protein